jgi:enolase
VGATRIVDVFGWEALDSRGRPTVACEVRLAGGARAAVAVPSGASKGSHEAREVRDGGPRYGGMGVARAVAALNGELRGAVMGLDASDQAGLDAVLRSVDGTPTLGRVGANAVLAVSVAAALAAAEAHGVPLFSWVGGGPEPRLPMPMVNVVSGGLHAGGGLDVQDFLVVPVGASTFREAIEWAWRVRRETSALLAERGHPVALVADEGGLGPVLGSNEEPLLLLVRGIERAGLTPGDDACIALDLAATQWWRPDGSYRLQREGRELRGEEVVELVTGWCARFPVASVEDPLAEDDWERWRALTEGAGGRVQVLGDDLFATDLSRLERGIRERAGTAVLVKPNQAGTLSDAASVASRAAAAGWQVVVSARSGDTEDWWLADLAVGWGAPQVKVGSVTRSERTAKWNRLLYLEARYGEGASFWGRAALPRWRPPGARPPAPGPGPGAEPTDWR